MPESRSSGGPVSGAKVEKVECDQHPQPRYLIVTSSSFADGVVISLDTHSGEASFASS
jgi:hypothetical protein